MSYVLPYVAGFLFRLFLCWQYAVEWIGVGRSDRPDFPYKDVCMTDITHRSCSFIPLWLTSMTVLTTLLSENLKSGGKR